MTLSRFEQHIADLIVSTTGLSQALSRGPDGEYQTDWVQSKFITWEAATRGMSPCEKQCEAQVFQAQILQLKDLLAQSSLKPLPFIGCTCFDEQAKSLCANKGKCSTLVAYK